MSNAKLYQVFARTWQARENCESRMADGKTNESASFAMYWHDKHTDTIVKLCKEHMPSGSGFDNGTHLDFGASRPNRLVFNTAYHHMNDVGMYDGWTEHQVIITPSLISGFDLRVSGRDRRDIKEHINECFNIALNSEMPKE